jgi:hypothetical protein
VFDNLTFSNVSAMAGSWLSANATPLALLMGLFVFLFVIDLVIGAVAKRHGGGTDSAGSGE